MTDREPGMEEFDLEADAGYVYLREGVVAQTRRVGDRVLADYDTAGRLLGYELFSLADAFPPWPDEPCT